jgi:hypothetical protein
MKRTCGLLDALQLHAVAQRLVHVLLHHQLHGVHLAGHGGQLVHLGDVVVLLADFLHEAAALLVQRALLRGAGFVTGLAHKLCGLPM